jgi:cytochrome c-type biogenesis protein CcmE
MSDLVPPPPAIAGGRSKWFALGALALAAVAFFAIATGGIGKNLVYYWGPTDLANAGERAVGATIRLGGQVAPGSVKYGADSSSLTFEVRDPRAVVKVHSTGVPPQMFRENVGVVVEGTMTAGGVFESSRLMVSHDNEYRAPKAGEDVRTADLMKSTADLPKAEKY